MAVHTANFLVEWRPSTTWIDITSFVMEVEGDFQTTGSGNGIGFGDSSDATARIKIDPKAHGSSLSLATWSYVPIRVTFSADANTAKGVAGIILEMQQDSDTATFNVIGYKQLISTVRVYSPLLHNRYVATKTSAALAAVGQSVDDPASTGYAAGLLNWIMWQAGGRPYEAAATYISAAFYYSLAQAPIAPAYSWVAGEDGWAEALRCVRACGGQLYQRPDGVVCYVSPLTIAGGSAVFTLTNGDYATVERRSTARDVVSSFNCTYVGRVVAGMTEIVNDTTPRLVAIGATITVELEPQYPFTSLQTATGGTQLLSDAISATCYDGTIPAQGSSGYAHTLTITAQHITITITNTGYLPFVIEKIVLRGTPLVPTEPGTVTFGSGNPTQTIEDNPLIQSRSHAQRLVRMALAFYGTARPIITVSGVRYDPTKHQIGSCGTLTVAGWGLSAVPAVILAVKHSETGIECDLDVIDTTGLPTLSQYFIIQTASQSGTTKKIGY